MKKYISEHDWDCLYGKIDLNGYTIIGINHQVSMLRDRIRDYKLRHLKLGKVHYDGKPFSKHSFSIKGMSWDMHWQLNRYLAIIIRDYLRYFAENTPAVGNCMLEDVPEILPGYKDLGDDFDFYHNRWIEKLISVSNSFDDLRKEIESSSLSGSEEEYNNLIKTSFQDLAYIFKDLEW